jgi:hypothetical protein
MLTVALNGYIPSAGDIFPFLTASQVTGAFTSTNLPTLASSLVWRVDYGVNAVTLAVNLAGDFNRDGAVDLADYVVWRDNNLSQQLYNTWRANFGQTAPAASAMTSSDAAVPEPVTWLALTVFAVAATTIRVSERHTWASLSETRVGEINPIGTE